MEEDSLNMPNWGWGYYNQPSFRGTVSLDLMPSVGERNTRPFLPVHVNSVVNTSGPMNSRDYLTSEAPTHMDYLRADWINHRSRFPHMLPGNHYNNAVVPESFGAHSLQMIQPSDSPKDVKVPVDDPSVRKENGSMKRAGSASLKTPKVKKAKKASSFPKGNGNTSVHRTKTAKKRVDVVINGINMDMSVIPIPVCSCTGAPQQCYRWGCGGWQSACCTTSISMYPLPMNTKRRGARIAGRKMSQGAFKKVLEKLAADGYGFIDPIDLRTHWAKHGTNKFVTIR